MPWWAERPRSDRAEGICATDYDDFNVRNSIIIGRHAAALYPLPKLLSFPLQLCLIALFLSPWRKCGKGRLVSIAN